MTLNSWGVPFQSDVIADNLSLGLYQLTAVHLVDAHLCSDPGKYISALLLSLSTMLHLELPHINVLSKIDLIGSYGKLGFVFFFFLSHAAWALRFEQNILKCALLFLLQLSTSISTQMPKTYHICSTTLIRILVHLNTGL